MAFSETATKCLNCSHERVVLIEDSSTFDVGAVRNGVVIFFAAWSAPSHVALQAYSAKLNELNPKVPVWVLNVDTLTREIDSKFDGAKHGYGEAFFFKDGLQVDRLLRLDGDYASNFAVKWQASFDP
jgi:hypothetical protein